MKKILLILFICCTLQCRAQHHRDFDTEKEFLEFLYKNSNKIKADPDDYFDELSEWDLSNNTLKQKMKILFKNDKNLNQKLKELEEARIFTYQGALTNVQANYEQYHYVDGLYFDYLVDRGDLEVKEIILKILKDPKISKSDKEDIEVYLEFYEYYISDPDGYTNVREGKSTSSKIIATVDSGLPIRVLDTTGNWWQVMTKDNEIGYIHKSRIKKR
ncbi:SH3 domain-containing protein [Capnocytophaga sp. oral taxon 326]|uniref:SH3 domain-containing protein n=1 Tax=Capnocytophaga sp. oral taxon 326 TaxID=712212 RepID=UPI0002A41120|nr:SH3 domain-containing protein [Capnocytophaga sp. oral taxon 326]EKY15530.1 SH3 domain protein [Capnocytophaga sp. oral taxon 326 str. F0382]